MEGETDLYTHPHAQHFPYLQKALAEKDLKQACHDLFGTMRHNSLAGLCRNLEAMLAMYRDLLPWTEEKVSEVLNLLRTQCCTPMRPLRWHIALKKLSRLMGYDVIWDTPYVSQKREGF